MYFLSSSESELNPANHVLSDPRWEASDGVSEESPENCQPVHGPVTAGPAVH